MSRRKRLAITAAAVLLTLTISAAVLILRSPPPLVLRMESIQAGRVFLEFQNRTPRALNPISAIWKWERQEGDHWVGANAPKASHALPMPIQVPAFDRGFGKLNFSISAPPPGVWRLAVTFEHPWSDQLDRLLVKLGITRLKLPPCRRLVHSLPMVIQNGVETRSTPAMPVASGLVVHFTFDERKPGKGGASMMQDHSGRRNDGLIRAAALAS